MRLILIAPTNVTKSVLIHALLNEPWVIETASDFVAARSKLRWVDLICLTATSDLSIVIDWIDRIQELVPLTRIVVLLNHDSAETRAQLIDLGADDCISLPISSDELRARISAVMRR